MNNRKYKQFQEEVMPSLKNKFEYTNDLQVPRLKKIVISRGINSEEARSTNVLDELVQDIALISGQKPIIRKAKKSIASFKIRDGMPNGIMVTLRKERMYSFFDRFVSIASPRIRDFQGFKIKSDKKGNITIGVKDQRIFVEAENRSNKGFQFTIVTSAQTEAEGKALIEELGFPVSKN
ncbi:MAG: 50S ribosomal protein L5 [Candidatus Caenarcaniphilales bacterium]|nr:50S ribosomal protein L5 [Candidatus Caenarcaniphilales bacterium]